MTERQERDGIHICDNGKRDSWSLVLKGMYPVWICYGRKLSGVDVIPHNSICLWCILGQVDHHACAVIGNNPKHEG